MNNTFDIRRFANYFVYDLKNFRDRFGLSMSVIACLPVILYVFHVLFGLIFSQEWIVPGETARATAFLMAFVIVFLAFPSKTYGFVTDKKDGSNWLMIPASSLEKFTSMLLVSLVVMPIAFFGIYFLTDAIVCLADSRCGELVYNNFFEKMTVEIEAEGINLNVWQALYVSFAANLLLYLLGAIVFKKGKIVYTIVAQCLFSTLLVCVFALLVINIEDTDSIESFLKNNLNAENFEFWINFAINLYYAVLIGCLGAGIYFKIKTLKH